MTSFATRNALINRLHAKKKAGKANGFTMIELVVVIAIVGVLSAVALPQMAGQIDKSKNMAAKTTAVNGAMSCSMLILGGDDGTGYDSPNTPDGVTLTETCSPGGSFAAVGPSETWIVTLTDGIPGAPVKSAGGG